MLVYPRHPIDIAYGLHLEILLEILQLKSYNSLSHGDSILVGTQSLVPDFDRLDIENLALIDKYMAAY